VVAVAPEARTDDVVEERAKRGDDDVERTGDQEGPVAEAAVLADPGEAGGKDRGSSCWLNSSHASASSWAIGAPSYRR